MLMRIHVQATDKPLLVYNNIILYILLYITTLYTLLPHTHESNLYFWREYRGMISL